MNPSPPIIGIVGGFGPDTSALFCTRLVQHAHALAPGRPPAFIMDSVSVPPEDSHAAINGSRPAGKRLAARIRQSISRLASLGVRSVAIPCNTIHLFVDEFGIPESLAFLHIVDAVITELQRQGHDCVGLLATRMTLQSPLYTERLAAAGISSLLPAENLQEDLSRHIAHFVRSGSVLPGSRSLFECIGEDLERRGAQCLALACTDLSGMMTACGAETSIPSVDSMDILAKACARVCV